MIYNTIHRKLKIKELKRQEKNPNKNNNNKNPPIKPGNSGASEG